MSSVLSKPTARHKDMSVYNNITHRKVFKLNTIMYVIGNKYN